jgi:hypothetical protein
VIIFIPYSARKGNLSFVVLNNLGAFGKQQIGTLIPVKKRDQDGCFAVSDIGILICLLLMIFQPGFNQVI